MKELTKRDKIVSVLLTLILLVLCAFFFFGKNMIDPCEACQFKVDKYDIGVTNCKEFANKMVTECNCICGGDINQPLISIPILP